jgi:hypothetical protein
MALVLNLVYNHRYEGNIGRLTEIYGPRFSHVNHLIPFARSKAPSVVRVWENGVTFSSHIAQAYDRIVTKGVSHYVFAADDLLLNPAIDECNLLDLCGIGKDEAYTKNLAALGEAYYLWVYLTRVVNMLRKPCFAFKSELPDISTALDLYTRLGIKNSETSLRGLSHWNRKIILTLRDVLRHPQFVLEAIRATLFHEPKYPLLFGYSDFFVVPARGFEDFAHYCGVFGALNLFAEVAIPTALALACPIVRTEYLPGEVFAGCKAPEVNPERQWRGKEWWGSEIREFEDRYGLSLQRLVDEFPEHCIYVHPVKLSKWK